MPIPAGNSRAAPAPAFEALHGAPAGERGEASVVRAGCAAQEFIVELATERAADPAFCVLWRALVMAGNSHQKIYQTPEFFAFQRETCDHGERLEVLTVSRRSDSALVGVIPVRLARRDVVFGIGELVLYKASVEIVNILGSVPAVPGGAAMAHFIGLEILAAFPQAKAIFMQSLPLHSAHWCNLGDCDHGKPALGCALLGQWRDCHTLPLPATFEQYLNNFSAKKRYNLNRQIRQLGERAGPLALQRISRPGDVAQMVTALLSLPQPLRPATGMLRPVTFEALARRDLLLCYVLRAGDQVLAAVIGTRSPAVWHVHNIFVNREHLSLSVGTSVVHLAIKDLMAERCFDMIDFGFGTPNRDFRSSHVLETRAQVLLFERSRPVQLLFRAHALFNTVADSAIAKVKALRKALHAARREKRA